MGNQPRRTAATNKNASNQRSDLNSKRPNCCKLPAVGDRRSVHHFQIPIARHRCPPKSPAGSFPGGFRTPAPVPSRHANMGPSSETLHNSGRADKPDNFRGDRASCGIVDHLSCHYLFEGSLDRAEGVLGPLEPAVLVDKFMEFRPAVLQSHRSCQRGDAPNCRRLNFDQPPCRSPPCVNGRGRGRSSVVAM